MSNPNQSPISIEHLCDECPTEITPGYLNHYRDAHANVVAKTRRRIESYVPRDRVADYELLSLVTRVEMNAEQGQALPTHDGVTGHLVCIPLETVSLYVVAMRPTTALALCDLTRDDGNYHVRWIESPLEHMICSEVAPGDMQSLYPADLTNSGRLRANVVRSESHDRQARYFVPVRLCSPACSDPKNMRLYVDSEECGRVNCILRWHVPG